MRPEVIDLFCGVGGLTRGLLNAGLKVKAGFDFDKTCEFAYTSNNQVKFIRQDVKETKADLELNFTNIKERIIKKLEDFKKEDTLDRNITN